MMEDRDMQSPPARYEAALQTCFGHRKQVASKCKHALHPSAPYHIPLCPWCIAVCAKARLKMALGNLIAEGGLSPAKEHRDRKWQLVKLRYEMAAKEQTRLRIRDQLRLEREQAWNEAHQQFDSQRCQAAVIFQDGAECPVCASMNSHYPTNVAPMQEPMDMAWWEKPGAMVAERTIVPKIPVRLTRRRRQPLHTSFQPSVLRRMIQHTRAALAATAAFRETWETRYRTELAVRRKHGLDKSFRTDPDFWDMPISGVLTRQNHQAFLENQRMEERQVRGNAPRPKPPRSWLSYSECSADVNVDESMLERLRREEQIEEMQRAARKVGSEVGYLYFVGDINCCSSNRQLIHRRTTVRSESESESVSPTSELDDSEEDEKDDDDYDLDRMEM